MEIQKEKIAHEKHLLSQGVDFKYLPNIQYNELENVYELIEWDEEYSEALNEINSSWCTWQAAKSQAVPEWKDYSQQSPRIDGRYQIFINGEQLAADWKSPFGFADPIEGVALIQDLITHWAVLSADPVIMEQSNEH